MGIKHNVSGMLMKVAFRIFDCIKYHGIEFYYFVSHWLLDQRILIPLCVVFMLFFPSRVLKQEFPTFRVVIDPGHGGIGRNPMSVHGDRFDAISGRYLDSFKYGASLRDLHEHDIVYNIAIKTIKYLQYLAPGGDHNKFYQLLEKYSDAMPGNINIITYMSRKKSITDLEADEIEDPNALYRIFDYPDKEGVIKSGRLSRINAVKPHLVVSLHMAETGPRDYEGMNPVITPAYDYLLNGLLYLKGDAARKKNYQHSPYREWFVESETRSDFEWFLNDASLYFTGYPLKKNLELDRGSFKGYRYNMVQWSYADIPGWRYPAKFHMPNTKYSSSIKNFVPLGKFWDRERTNYERYRRDGGPEGYGGDNAYASYEIVRYILYSMYLHGDDHRTQKPGKSYISVWIVPLHVNAISAFIELGYLNRARDRFILTRKQEVMAEGIAVGIYSLLNGLAMKSQKYRYVPRGKKLDLNKYHITDDESYFDAVNDD
jgi:hypothetical protein